MPNSDSSQSVPFAWRLRDSIAAATLLLATAAVVLWQNAHVAVLWDLSYVLDTATRIAQGQLPYRDFPLAHAPLTFLIQAALIRLTGRVFFHHALYAAIAGGLVSVLGWRIVLGVLRGRFAAQPASANQPGRPTLGASLFLRLGWSSKELDPDSSIWWLSLVLSAPLAVLGIYCVFPFPSYDCDAILAVLLGVFLLARLDRPNWLGRIEAGGILPGVAAGAALCLPLFFKQNIGLPFLLTVVALVVLLLLIRPSNRSTVPHPLRRFYREMGGKPTHYSRAGSTVVRRLHPTASAAPSTRTLFSILSGAAATLGLAALALQFTVGLGNYWHWTIGFAAQRRMPALAAMAGVYQNPFLYWSLPVVVAGLLPLRGPLARQRWAQTLPTHIAAFSLLAAPFIYTLATLLIYDDADERGDSLLALWPLLLVLAAALVLARLVALFRGGRPSLNALLPIAALAAIHGALMSQQLWGSTYALWPLFLYLLAELLPSLTPDTSEPPNSPLPRWFIPALAFVASLTLLVCGGFYTASEERLNYADLPDGPAATSTLPALAGLSTPGPYLSDLDELVNFTQMAIPSADTVLLLPGEDPFYFATGRTPRFPVLLFDPATDPYTSQQLVDEARKRQVHWLVVKRTLQIKQDPTPDDAATLRLFQREYFPVARLHGYDVYHYAGMHPGAGIHGADMHGGGAIPMGMHP